MKLVQPSQSETSRAPRAAERGNDPRIGLRFGGFEHSAGFLLRIAQLTAFERFFAARGEGDVKISEFIVLVAIQTNPGIRQGVLADVLKIKWPNMTKLVRELEGKGWISRHIPPNDRRSVELRVTSEGLRAIDMESQSMLDADRAAVGVLDDDEHALLLKLLRKIAGWTPDSATGGEEDQ